ncbi:MAG: nickel-dependent lactate racemase, partial [Halobacteriota archaeon]|nr:nickel-dependent lactate racemase [Halobacteriota archaeon]
RLRDIVQLGDSVAVITSDITRSSPSSKLLPPLLNELNRGGVKDEDITVVFALGIHRRQTEEEKRCLVGPEVYSRVRCVDHDIDDCVDVGTIVDGRTIKVTREVATADKIVCTGNIEFHYFAGYSGGSKAILPGVVSRDLIEENHKMMISTDAYSGSKKSPVRREMDEVGGVVGIDFILNVVLNPKKEVIGAVAGDYISAHKRGIEMVDDIYQVPSVLSDIVITCPGGDPKDIDLCQAQKALDNARYAVKEGGSIILVASCHEGYGMGVFGRWMDEAKSPEDIITRFHSKFELGGHRAAAIALLLRKADLYLVSDMPDERVKNIFMIPEESVEDALGHALEKHGKDASVLVMPHGGLTLPYVK